MRILFAGILLVCCAGFAFTQINLEEKTLAVLTFHGGETGEGETLATLFSNQLARMNSFKSVVTRIDSGLQSILAEHNFQLTGLTDDKTMASLGGMFNAEYVLSGNIRKLGRRNLLIVTIIDLKTFELIAGVYKPYNTLGELQSLIPSISTSLVADTRAREISNADNLAIGPFTHIPEIDEHDAETLALILAIDILKIGNYSILPRISTIQSTISTEQDVQTGGLTGDEGMVSIGQAFNAGYVMSGSISRLGNIKVFTVQILRIEDRSIFLGESRNYRDITDGIYLMEEIAIRLTDPDNAEERITELNNAEGRDERRKFLADEKKELEQAERQRLAEIRKQERAERRRKDQEDFSKLPLIGAIAAQADKSVRNEMEYLSLFIGWETFSGNKAAGTSALPILVPSGVYWSPAPFIVLGIETRWIDFGDGNAEGDNYDSRFRSIAPAIGLVLAVGERGRIFTNFLFDMGDLNKRGVITDDITPGFNLGYIFNPPGILEDIVTFNVKYRCIFLKDQESTQAIDFAISVTFEALGNLFSRIF